MPASGWRYYLPPTGGPCSDPGYDSWSVVFVDPGGIVAVVSDFGNWAYRWNARYCEPTNDFRRAFLSFDSDYVYTKLSMGAREVFDVEATSKLLRERILDDRRYGSHYSAADARLDYTDAGEEHLGSEGFGGFMRGVGCRKTEEQQVRAQERRQNRFWEMEQTEVPGLRHWTTVSLLRLQQLIRAQLALEPQVAARRLEGVVHG